VVDVGVGGVAGVAGEGYEIYESTLCVPNSAHPLNTSGSLGLLADLNVRPRFDLTCLLSQIRRKWGEQEGRRNWSSRHDIILRRDNSSFARASSRGQSDGLQGDRSSTPS
jgi:hypothetical protein